MQTRPSRTQSEYSYTLRLSSLISLDQLTAAAVLVRPVTQHTCTLCSHDKLPEIGRCSWPTSDENDQEPLARLVLRLPWLWLGAPSHPSDSHLPCPYPAHRLFPLSQVLRPRPRPDAGEGRRAWAHGHGGGPSASRCLKDNSSCRRDRVPVVITQHRHAHASTLIMTSAVRP